MLKQIFKLIIDIAKKTFVNFQNKLVAGIKSNEGVQVNSNSNMDLRLLYNGIGLEIII